jgi:hypothetical protein
LYSGSLLHVAVWSRALGGEEFVQVDEFGDPSLDRRHYEKPRAQDPARRRGVGFDRTGLRWRVL